VSKLEIRSDSEPDTEQLPLRLAKREAQPLPRMPKWWPLICTSWGITCGDSGTSNGDDNGNSDGNSDGNSSGNSSGGSNTELSSVSTTKRETEPVPMAEAQPEPKKVPKWVPTACTSRGITCGDSGTSNGDSNGNSDGNSSGDSNGGSNTELSSVSAKKREAEPVPMAEAQPEPKKVPKWVPTACTSRGITCGDSSSVGQSSDGGNTGADSASSAAS
jgi:hypothetical protein